VKRAEMVRDLTNYFRSSDQWMRLLMMLQDPDPRNAHIHLYMETCVHPTSLQKIVEGFFEIVGWPSDRKIDWLTPKKGMGSLHGIEPKGKPHFDIFWVYNKDAAIQPMEGGEGGNNLLGWNRWYIETFYKNYPFRRATAADEKALEQYFKSDHWEKGLEYVKRPNTRHFHFNIETSIHPEDIRRHAVPALNSRDWEVFYVCPNVFMVKGEYRGKLVFLGKKPEEVYDIGWKFNPNVSIKPAEEPWNFPKPIGYDWLTWEMVEEELNAHPYIQLDEADIQAVLSGCASKHKPS